MYSYILLLFRYRYINILYQLNCNCKYITHLSIVYINISVCVLDKFTNVCVSAGMLVCRRTGFVLKPATKAILGEREIAFYEKLKNSHDSTIVQLKKFVPHYFGTTELRVFNKRKDFFYNPDTMQYLCDVK